MKLDSNYKKLLTKKVYAKLAQEKKYSFEIEAGFKDWFAGVALALTTAITGMSEAGATAKDLDKYLDNALSDAKTKNPELKKHIKVEKSMTYTRAIEDGGGGGGDFKVHIGPFVLEGFYHRLGETDHGQFEFEESFDLQGKKYTEKDLNEFKPLVKEFIADARDALWKNKSKIKK